jgi:hypothetical protein
MDFQSIPLHIAYNFQDFEPIEYVNGLSWLSPIFQANNPKVHIDLDDFPFFWELMRKILRFNFHSHLHIYIEMKNLTLH